MELFLWIYLLLFRYVSTEKPAEENSESREYLFGRIHPHGGLLGLPSLPLYGPASPALGLGTSPVIANYLLGRSGVTSPALTTSLLGGIGLTDGLTSPLLRGITGTSGIGDSLRKEPRTSSRHPGLIYRRLSALQRDNRGSHSKLNFLQDDGDNNDRLKLLGLKQERLKHQNMLQQLQGLQGLGLLNQRQQQLPQSLKHLDLLNPFYKQAELNALMELIILRNILDQNSPSNILGDIKPTNLLGSPSFVSPHQLLNRNLGLLHTSPSSDSPSTAQLLRSSYEPKTNNFGLGLNGRGSGIPISPRPQHILPTRASFQSLRTKNDPFHRQENKDFGHFTRDVDDSQLNEIRDSNDLFGKRKNRKIVRRI